MNFIKDNGTGQEIPDPPKYIDFCRGDAEDAMSEASANEAYTMAQFPRPINPTPPLPLPHGSQRETPNPPPLLYTACCLSSTRDKPCRGPLGPADGHIGLGGGEVERKARKVHLAPERAHNVVLL